MKKKVSRKKVTRKAKATNFAKNCWLTYRKVVVFAIIAGSLFFLLNFHSRFVASAGIQVGYKLCQQGRDASLEADYQDFTVGHRDSPQ